MRVLDLLTCDGNVLGDVARARACVRVRVPPVSVTKTAGWVARLSLTDVGSVRRAFLVRSELFNTEQNRGLAFNLDTPGLYEADSWRRPRTLRYVFEFTAEGDIRRIDRPRRRLGELEGRDPEAEDRHLGLVALTGSSRQVNWAEDIRRTSLSNLERVVAEATSSLGDMDPRRVFFEDFRNWMHQQADARFWIITRDAHASEVFDDQYLFSRRWWLEAETLLESDEFRRVSRSCWNVLRGHTWATAALEERAEPYVGDHGLGSNDEHG